MTTSFTKERDAKLAAKVAKKKAETDEKERQQQAKVVEEFTDKQTKAAAAADPMGKLKAWCNKPPYLDLTNEIKVSKSSPYISRPV